MMGRFVSLHTNIHDEASHFHLYVNAEYVNNPWGAGGADSCWTWIYHSHTVWSTDLLARTPASDIFLQRIYFEDGTQSHNRQYFPLFIHLLKLGQGFQAVRLDESGAKAEQMLSSSNEMEVMCFLTYLLIS